MAEIPSATPRASGAAPPPRVAPPSLYRWVRRFAYELLQSPEIETALERWVRAGISILIGLNVLVVVVETVPAASGRFEGVFSAFEAFSVAVFTVEYLLRLWSAVEDPRYGRPILGRLRFALTFFALVDLVAILPFFIPHLVKCDLRFVRALRLVRLARVFKLGRYSTSLSMYGRILRDKRDELVVSLALLVLLLLIASSAMYLFEHEAQPQQFSSIPAAMWWGS